MLAFQARMRAGAHSGQRRPKLGQSSWRSWVALWAYVGCLGPNASGAERERAKSGSNAMPMLTVLGRSWGLCWRSWAALWAYAGCRDPNASGSGLSRPKCERQRAKSSPNASGSAFRQRAKRSAVRSAVRGTGLQPIDRCLDLRTLKWK